MFSWFKIEIASLVFAFLSLLSTVSSFFVFSVRAIQLNIFMTTLIGIKANETEYPNGIQNAIVHYGMYINLNLAILLSIIVIFFIFSVILTKGLLSKNIDLVKGYFIFGVTMNTLTVLFGLLLTFTASTKIGLLILLGCSLYGLCLMMIKKTYLKLATTEKDVCEEEKIEAENTISIKL